MITPLQPNGGFDQGLYKWSGGNLASDRGYYRAPSAHLGAGDTLTSEPIQVVANTVYTVYFFAMFGGSNLKITFSFGGVTQEFKGNALPQNVWNEGARQFAFTVDSSTQFTAQVDAGEAWIDAITLGLGALPIARSDLANMVAARLRTLATSAGLSATASAAGPNGDYTLAIDDGLRAVGAVDANGDPSVVMLAPAQISDAVAAAYQSILIGLRADYALKTDVSLGPRTENLSQIATSLDKMLGGGAAAGDAGAVAGGGVAQSKLTYGDWPR